MYKKDLVKAISAKTGSTIKDVDTFLNTFIEVVTEELKNSGTVVMTGFGSFKTIKTKERAGRNPQTGKEITIASHNKVKFMPGKELKDSLN